MRRRRRFPPPSTPSGLYSTSFATGTLSTTQAISFASGSRCLDSVKRVSIANKATSQATTHTPLESQPLPPLPFPLFHPLENRFLSISDAKEPNGKMGAQFHFFLPEVKSVLLMLLVSPPMYSCNALLSRSNFSCPVFTLSIFSTSAARPA